MKGYIIPFGSRSMVSINKKIDLQKSQLASICEMYETDVTVDVSNRWKILISIFLHGSLPVDYTRARAELKDPDFVFIRHAGADRQFVRFLKWIRETYPACRIVVEIPTYPYMKEHLASIVNWLLLPAELFNRRKLKKYVDRFFVYCQEKDIFGIRTIRSMNGINVDSIVPVESELSDTINLIAVAHMQHYHGYERIIKGIAAYYRSGPDRKVELFLVGDGSELEKYRQLVQKERIGEHVHFCGKLIGDDLKKAFQNAALAIEALGYYKIGLHVSTTLKVREYLAYGLPVISGNQVDVFNRYPFPYHLEFPNDDSAINVRDIIAFYDRIYQERSRREISEEIHRYAKEHVDISMTMKPLLDYLENC